MASCFVVAILLLILIDQLHADKVNPEPARDIDAYLRELVLNMSNKIETLEERYKMLEDRTQQCMIQDANTGITQISERALPTKYQFSSFGCLSDVISLGCTDGKTIFVDISYFGQYYNLCSGGCCPPHPGLDCVEVAEDSQLEVWLAVKALCDNQTSCQYQYEGSTIDSCEPGYIADYMTIYYTCLPEETDGPVSFAAYHDIEKQYTEVHEMVRFDSVFSNLGGHFELLSNVFICPQHGIYGFGMSVYNLPDLSISCRIMKENVRLTSIWAYSTSNSYNAASNFIVTECLKGDRVYVDTGTDVASPLYGGDGDDRVVFSGVLIYRID